jgi:uncharacterized membrane protein YfcA
MAAGAINAAVGSGTLVTFPVLLGLGYPPVLANVSNTIGLVPGSVAGAIAYRHQLAGMGALVFRLSIASALGGVTGALLLLWLPPHAFDAIVPVFVAGALVLVVLQPKLTRPLEEDERPSGPFAGRRTLAAVSGVGVYGGYFGAAQGIVLISILALMLGESLQQANGTKNLLTGLTNLVAGAIFVVATEVDWAVAGLIAVGSVTGGYVGARLARRSPDSVLRAVIVLVGSYAIVRLVA